MLNPLETLALPHLSSQVLDLGCELGNLSVAAARGGCVVPALDAALAEITDLRRRAQSLVLPITAEVVDLAQYRTLLVKYGELARTTLVYGSRCEAGSWRASSRQSV